MRLIAERVEALPELPALLACDLVVDAMGWTRHWEALKDPEYDLELNLRSHLAVIRAPRRAVRSCSSISARATNTATSRRGRCRSEALAPADVQGVHKAAAEHHYRIASGRLGVAVVSLRFGDSFGPGQPMEGRDIGLIGDMIRTVLSGEAITVFGEGRRRMLHYAPDLAGVVERIALVGASGFLPLNIPGEDIAIGDLARRIAEAAGGTVKSAPTPPELAAIDVANTPLDCTAFESRYGVAKLTPLSEALAATVEDVRRRLAG